MNNSTLDTYLSDTYGTLLFEESSRPSLSNFIKISSDDVEKQAEDLYRFIIEKWKFPRAKLLVSVVGDLKDEDLDEVIMNDFHEEMCSISSTPGLWVVTSGHHDSIVKHLGGALMDGEATCLGLPSWSTTEHRDDLMTLEPGQMYSYDLGNLGVRPGCLDPIHSGFVLLENSKDSSEMHFRAQFEDFIVRKEKIPRVLVVIGGKTEQFDLIYSTISSGDSVVLFPGTGGVSDWILNIIEGNIEGETEDGFKEEMRCTLGDKYDEKVEIIRKNKLLFKIFDQNKTQSYSLKELMINVHSKEISCLLTANYFRLLLTWQFPYNFLKKDIQAHIHYITIVAFARADVEMVNILLNDFHVNIRDMFTFNVLKLLFGFQSHEKNFPRPMKEDSETKFIFPSKQQNTRYTVDYEKVEYDSEWKEFIRKIYYWSSRNVLNVEHNCVMTTESLKVLRQGFVERQVLLKDLKSEQGAKMFDWFQNVRLEDPYTELFIWATVCNLPNMVKLLWGFQRFQLAKSLIASSFFENQALRQANYLDREDYLKHHAELNLLTSRTLDECYTRDSEQTKRLLTTPCDMVNQKTRLELAANVNCVEFIAHPSSRCIYSFTSIFCYCLHALHLLSFSLMFYVCYVLFVYYEGKELKNWITWEQWIARSTKNKSHHIVRNSTDDFFVDDKKVAPTIPDLLMVDYNVTTTLAIVWLYWFSYVTTQLHKIGQFDEKTWSGKLYAWFYEPYSGNVLDVFNLLVFFVAAVLRMAVFDRETVFVL